MNAEELIAKAKAAGYTASTQEKNTGNETTKTTLIGQNKAPEELYAQSDAIQRKLSKQTDFIRSGKQHARLSRRELIQATRKLLDDLAAVSAQITPGNKHGHTDLRDGECPFSPYCLDIWANEIDMLERGHNATPIDKNDPPAGGAISAQGEPETPAAVQQSALF
ncbi:MAG TPA: hypothetical protein VN519_06595 [Bryobacteraceae bacterium]|nr:hypothetical protein [Bryobacteraceae bacterium]